jgi:flagellar biosynthesis/type III secretory pathway protein FliH
MKAQKVLAVFATASLLGLSVGCNDRYADGFADGETQGYNNGYDDGYSDGDTAGFERAKVYFASADYNDGFSDGKTAGIEIGYDQGYSVGRSDGKTEGYNLGYTSGKTDGRVEGYNTGYNDGYDDGYDNGYDDGGAGAYTAGYNDGYSDGNYAGYNTGYDDGFGDGYDTGYDDGFSDGYGLSVGKTKKLKGYANLLSMVHNDLFDYSKIKAPKQTAKGLVAGGRLLLSETGSTSKDTLKRNAVVEQYLVVEMAKQVKSKFGLSDERSLKVAKAANHFRKYSSQRALTAEDTNAYAEEILGVNFKSIEKAYSQSMKGDISELNSVLKKAADKNGISPEKMGTIVTKLFI